MLFVLGSILAGVLLYDATRSGREASADDMEMRSEANANPPRPTKATVEAGAKEDDALTVVYHIKSGEGEVSLPPCKLVAVGLGPSTNPNKATLQIMVNKSVKTKFKPITNIESEAKRMKLTPTQYQTNIVLKTKKKGKVPITAYYST